MELTARQKQQLRKSFRAEGAILAYLFGSRVGGYAKSESDFDIAVYLGNKNKKKDLFKIKMNLIREASRILKTDKADVVIIDEIRSPVLKFVIIQEGKVLFSSNESARMDLELKMINQYHDHRPILEMYDQRLLKER
ncbi:MAG: type VII toxin-antitoxin system MntA family adenylyltransferase antitoxin [Patescibacteria group bacterium]